MNVSAISEVLGLSESAVSHQLRGLRQMGLVIPRREGKEIYYRIEDGHILSLFEQGVSHVRLG
jgi:ArsR family transcriptional regulator